MQENTSLSDSVEVVAKEFLLYITFLFFYFVSCTLCAESHVQNCVHVCFMYHYPHPTSPVSVGTWVTFGGQITDEVRADGFCHLPSVKA